MNGLELFNAEGKSVGRFYCAKCGIIWPSKPSADQCCDTYKCRDCGAETGGRMYLVCDTCRAKERAAKEAERFAKAEKLTQWDGWVFSEGHDSDYFQSVAEFVEFCENEGIDLPPYVWACSKNHFVKADIGDITEQFCDSAWEDFDPDDLNGLPELKAAIAAFVEANKDVCSYQPDYTKAVILEQPTNP